MTPEQFDAICRAALERYGTPHQVQKFCEEAAEAQVAVCHWQRGRGSRVTECVAVCEELADLRIMMRQMQIVAKIPDERLDAIVSAKLARLQHRMESNEE